MTSTGKLFLVSVGPGHRDLIPPRAEAAIQASEVVVGYGLYLQAIEPWLTKKEVHSIPLTQEKERALKSIEMARQGRKVSLVSSGDIGIYAMAALVLEELLDSDTLGLEIIPGISAANSCASLLGSPLSHDFATLSLSDLLCPWEWIEQRARHLAQADMAVVLYNVQSRQRVEGVYKILDLFAEFKAKETWCGIVKNAYREGEEKTICSLEELSHRRFDMLTTIIIGNRFTQRKREFIYTPRGYNSWSASTENSAAPVPVSEPSIWVFSGTSDGNALAAELATQSWKIIVSVASNYGRDVAKYKYPDLEIRTGGKGIEARRQELKSTWAQAIVDATHPYATQISTQLIALANELKIPYLRYERPAADLDLGTLLCPSLTEAGELAQQHGKRIFLATGAKDLSAFLDKCTDKSVIWFARVTPDPASVASALRAGIYPENLCAMQGPFSKEINEMLWRNWKIDCVVTKESGEAGGFAAKAAATRALNLPLIVVQRPKMHYPFSTLHFSEISAQLQKIPTLTNP